MPTEETDHEMTLDETVYLNPSREAVQFAWASEAAGRVWAITLDSFRELPIMLEHPVAIDPEAVGRRPGRPPNIRGGIAIVGLQGVLMGGGVSFLEMLFGMESGLSAFTRGFRNAADNPDVGAIVMDIDSPGGLVDLIPETAAMVREVAARDDKTVVAVANTLAASGAYWLASQANEIVVTPSGEAGSIGVYATHLDMSGRLEKEGVKPTLVSAGKHKTDGNPYEPLASDARAALQEAVDDYYTLFTKDVAAGRGVTAREVQNGFGEGRTLTAKRAVDAGLADRVASLDDVVAGLVRRSGGQEVAASEETPDVVTEEEVIEYTAEERERLVHTLANLGANR